MSEFQFKEYDKEGMETLESISQAANFNRWMFETIQPFCKGKIFEIGSGIGNISSQFIENGFKITVSDIRDVYCSYLTDHYAQKVEDVVNMDIVDPAFDEKHKELFGNFDTVFALNIVEHVEDDSLAIANAKKLLKEGGNLIILVPAYASLYNRFDRELEHYRRYTLKTLAEIFEANDLEIIHRQYFNFAAIAGWWFSGSVLKKKTIPNGQMKLYDKLVPVFKLIDKIILNKAGISAISVGRKS